MLRNDQVVVSSEYSIKELFQTHSIKEIRLIKSRTEEEITNKQNQLRTLVGERYYDIIDAADCMNSIQNLSALCTSQFQEMTKLIDEYKHKINNSNNDVLINDLKPSESENCKQFIQLTDWMFHCVTHEMYLYATTCYLSAISLLELITNKDSITMKIKLLEQFKNQLLVKCKNILLSNDKKDIEYIQCLASIKLCKKLTNLEIFKFYLQLRSQNITKFTKIEEIFNQFQITFFIAYHLFKKNKKNNLFFINHFIYQIMKYNFTKNVTNQKSFHFHFDLLNFVKEKDTKIITAILLQDSFIKLYEIFVKPKLETKLEETNETFFNEILQNWLTEYCNYLFKLFIVNKIKKMENLFDLINLKNNLKNLIFLKNAKNLANQFILILNYVYNKPCHLSQQQILTTEEEEIIKFLNLIWKDITLQFPILNNWNYLLTIFNEQIIYLIEKKFNDLSLFNFIDNNNLNDNLKEEENYKNEKIENIGEEIWKSNVVTSNVLFDRFIYKTNLQHFPTNLQSNNNNLLNNNLFYQPITISGTTKQVTKIVKNEFFEKQLQPFLLELFEIIKDIEIVNLNNIKEIEDIIFKNYFNLNQKYLKIIENLTKNLSIKKQLYFSRIIKCLKKLFYDLLIELMTQFYVKKLNLQSLQNNSVNSGIGLEQQDEYTFIKKLKLNLKKKENIFNENENLQKLFIETENLFNEIYLITFNDWITITTNQFINQTKEYLYPSSTNNKTINEDNSDNEFNTKWNHPSRREMWQQINLLKENEKISLPSRPSYSIYKALHELNISIYTIGDFTIERNVFELLSKSISLKVFPIYFDWMNEKVEQAKEKRRLEIEGLEKELKEEEEKVNVDTNNAAIVEEKKEVEEGQEEEEEGQVNNSETNTTNENPTTSETMTETLTDTSTTETEKTEEMKEDNKKEEEIKENIDEEEETLLLEEEINHKDINNNKNDKIKELKRKIQILKESSLPIDQYVCEEGLLQLLFDLKYLSYILLNGQTYEKLSLQQENILLEHEKYFIKVFKLILDQIDPINWETYEKSFYYLVLQSLQRNNLFTPNLSNNINTSNNLLLSSSNPSSGSTTPNSTTTGLLMSSLTPTSPISILDDEFTLTPTTPTALGSTASGGGTSSNYLKLCKSDSMNIQLLPIPKRETKQRFGSNNNTNFNDLSSFIENDNQSEVKLNQTLKQIEKQQERENLRQQNSVFGSFVGSLQNWMATPPQPSSTSSSLSTGDNNQQQQSKSNVSSPIRNNNSTNTNNNDTNKSSKSNENTPSRFGFSWF
ncbi:hypothetical protein ABK040_003876 [Willaertia magna]